MKRNRVFIFVMMLLCTSSLISSSRTHKKYYVRKPAISDLEHLVSSLQRQVVLEQKKNESLCVMINNLKQHIHKQQQEKSQLRDDYFAALRYAEAKKKEVQEWRAEFVRLAIDVMIDRKKIPCHVPASLVE